MALTDRDLGNRFTANFRIVGINKPNDEARIAFVDDDGVEIAGGGSRLTVSLIALEHAMADSIVNPYAPPTPAA